VEACTPGDAHMFLQDFLVGNALSHIAKQGELTHLMFISGLYPETMIDSIMDGIQIEYWQSRSLTV